MSIPPASFAPLRTAAAAHTALHGGSHRLQPSGSKAGCVTGGAVRGGGKGKAGRTKRFQGVLQRGLIDIDTLRPRLKGFVFSILLKAAPTTTSCPVGFEAEGEQLVVTLREYRRLRDTSGSPPDLWRCRILIIAVSLVIESCRSRSRPRRQLCDMTCCSSSRRDRGCPKSLRPHP